MESPMTLEVGTQANDSKDESSTIAPAPSFGGQFSTGNVDIKSELLPAANAFKSSDQPHLQVGNNFQLNADELSTLFCHEVFGQLKGHQCTICGRVFPFRYQLIVHARYHTLPSEEGGIGMPEMKNWNVMKPPAVSKPPPPKTHICSYCGRGFSRKEHLVSHLVKHTGITPHECQLCGKKFSRKDHLDNHIRAHESDFKCHICLKIFSRKEHLVAHIQWHTGSSPHRCDLCRKVFTRKEHLVAHVRQHTGESPHVCRYCGKSFTRREHVVNHERGHTGETPFKCEVCPKAFARRDHLVNHTRQHTGESPYKCTHCGKAFTRKEHLVNHTRQHTGESPHKCHFCSKSFTRRDHLMNHIKLHVPPGQEAVHRCSFCERAFSRRDQLTSHHCPQYTCHICSKSFPLKGNLLLHMNTHTTAATIGY